MISFPTKDEQRVKTAFHAFGLEKTSLELEYATVGPNRWSNYVLFANTDIPMIKRIKKNKHWLLIKHHFRFTLLPPVLGLSLVILGLYVAFGGYLAFKGLSLLRMYYSLS